MFFVRMEVFPVLRFRPINLVVISDFASAKLLMFPNQAFEKNQPIKISLPLKNIFPTFSVSEVNEETVFHINRFTDAAFGLAAHRFAPLLRR